MVFARVSEAQAKNLPDYSSSAPVDDDSTNNPRWPPTTPMPNISIHVAARGNPRAGDLIGLEIASDLRIVDLKEYISAEIGLDTSKQFLYLNGKLLADDMISLQQAGIGEGDVLQVTDQPPRSQAQTAGASSAAATQPSGSIEEQAERLRRRLLSDPVRYATELRAMPDLASALKYPEHFAQIFASKVRLQQLEQALEEDPFNIDLQRQVEQIIQQRNIDANLNHAQEYNPEFFAEVTMLYVHAKVNGVPIKILIDSGAQSTVMSPACADACNITRLIDTRFAGIARGVGEAKILGRVHSADIQIGNMTMACRFTVMEGKAVDFLLGLDMLKRYQVSIDLRKNKLVFADHQEVDFLPESELPREQEAERAAEPTIAGPDGTEIGTESGVVRQAGTTPKVKDDAAGQGSASGGGQSSSGTGTGTAAPTEQSKWPAENIQQLVRLGFDEKHAIAALDAANGNVDQAAYMLLVGEVQ